MWLVKFIEYTTSAHKAQLRTYFERNIKMQAVIPAAGMGRRLGSLTENVAKCMIKVNGVTLIERMAAQLDSLGLSRIVVIVGHQSGTLKDFLDNLGIKTPIVYVENMDYDKTNNIYSLYLAREYLKQENTLLIESDLIFEDSVLRCVIDDPLPSLALVAKFENWMDGSVVTIDEGGKIKDFLRKDDFRFEDIKSYYKTVNIYKFSREFSDKHYVPFLEAYCHALGHNEYYKQVLKVITKLDKSEIKAKVLTRGNWYEIDDLQDLDIAESIFTQDESEKFDRITRRYGGYWRYPSMTDFCYLVNPFFPPDKLMDEIKANFERLAREYPSGQRVNNLLAAKYFGCDKSKILVGNGAGELIKAILSKIDGKLGIVIPTFEEYPNRKKGEIVTFRPDNEDYAYTAEGLMNFFTGKPISALVLINPDNPSGNFIPKEGVIELAGWTLEAGIWFILDESFIDFACIYESLLSDSILVKFPNLIVVKSISKSFGVPGLRLGILASSDAKILQAVKEDLPIWNINSLAEFYLQICEKYKKDYENALAEFYKVRERFFADLEAVSYLKPVPSHANYIMCRVTGGVSSRELAVYLLNRHDILIKDLGKKQGVKADYVRVAVKLPEENQRLVDALLTAKPWLRLWKTSASLEV